MTTEIGKVKSSTSGKIYPIYRGKDGVEYCTCWAWKKNKRCKHLDKWIWAHGDDPNDDLRNIIDDVAEEMKGGLQ